MNYFQILCKSRLTLIILVLFSLLTNINIKAGSIPMPLEAQLDLAKQIVVGKITKIEPMENRNRDQIHFGNATLSIRQVLKGEKIDCITITITTWISKEYAMSAASPPKIHNIGDDGIWLFGLEWLSYGFIELSQLDNVQNIIKNLDERIWSDEVNGLRACSSVVNLFYNIDDTSNESPHIIFCVKNCSNNDISYPAPESFQTITVSLVNSQGKTFQCDLYNDKYARSTPLFFRVIKPGQIVYLHPEYTCIQLNAYIPPDKYKITVTLQNDKEGNWTGKLSAPPVNIVLPGKYIDTLDNGMNFFLNPKKRVFNLGEDILITVIYNNQSKNTLVMPSSYYTIDDKAGPAFRSGINTLLIGPNTEDKIIEPKSKARFKDGWKDQKPGEYGQFVFNLNDWYKLDQPGVYIFCLTFTREYSGFAEGKTRYKRFKLLQTK